MTKRGAIICFAGAALAAIGAGGGVTWATVVGVLMLMAGFTMAVIGRLSEK
jgi:hypothetical protein